MSFRFNKKDRELLVSLAEYRILGVGQLARLCDRNVRALRRRLRCLEQQGMVQIDGQPLGRGRGRPEGLVSLRNQAVGWLQAKGLLSLSVPADGVTAGGINARDHQLLVNEVRLQLTQIPRIVPSMSLQFLSPMSPWAMDPEDGYPLVHERFQPGGDEAEQIDFVPDGVFTITDDQLGKTLLFFLEVDMGTETLADPRRGKRDVRQKIVNYKAALRAHRYKRYQQLWGREVRGFRLLFVAHSWKRMAALCHLVRDMPPSAFTWLTDRAALLSKGVWAAIWAQGGQSDHPRESILDARMPGSCPCPSSVGECS